VSTTTIDKQIAAAKDAREMARQANDHDHFKRLSDEIVAMEEEKLEILRMDREKKAGYVRPAPGW
jgi:hypothetical protein